MRIARKLVFVLGCLSSLLLGGSAAASEEGDGWPARVLVVQAEAAAESPPKGGAVELMLAHGAEALALEGRLRVMTLDDLRTLTHHEAFLQLTTGEEAQVQLSAAVDADYVVTMQLTPDPTGGATLSLHAMDPARGSSVHREARRVELGEDLVPVVTEASRALRDTMLAHHAGVIGGMPRERSWLGRRGGVFWGATSVGAASLLVGGGLLTWSGRRTAGHNRDAQALDSWLEGGMIAQDRPSTGGLLDASEQTATRRVWAAGWVAGGVGLGLVLSGVLLDRPLPRFVTVGVRRDPLGQRGVYLVVGGGF